MIEGGNKGVSEGESFLVFFSNALLVMDDVILVFIVLTIRHNVISKAFVGIL